MSWQLVIKNSSLSIKTCLNITSTRTILKTLHHLNGSHILLVQKPTKVITSSSFLRSYSIDKESRKIERKNTNKKQATSVYELLLSLLQGEAMPSKKQSKMAAAYKICIQLHKMGELNDFLLPVEELSDESSDEDIEVEEQQGKAKRGTKRSKKMYLRKVIYIVDIYNHSLIHVLKNIAPSIIYVKTIVLLGTRGTNRQLTNTRKELLSVCLYQAQT